LLENNTGVSSRTEVNSQGNAGEIRITADSVVMEKDTGIDSETNGSGDGGIITIDAANSISLRNDSDIFSNTNAQGDAGRVELRASSFCLKMKAGWVVSPEVVGMPERSGLPLTRSGSQATVVLPPIPQVVGMPEKSRLTQALWCWKTTLG
jgi:hypothetical protein